MPKKKPEAEETALYIPSVSEKEKIIEKIRKEGIECKADSTGIPMFYTNDHETMDMMKRDR